MRIPISQTDLTGRETEYVNKALSDNWISCGQFMARAEKEFASLCQVKHAVMVNSGTSALHLTLAGLGIGPGDEVICPSLTYVATAAVIVQVGATPIFCDVSLDSWCIEASRIEEVLTPRTKAIMLVDLYGAVADLNPILELGKIHGIPVIDDCAESHGALYKGKPSSSYMDAACYSFYANKPLTGGELGAVLTNDSKLAAHLAILRGQGQHPTHRFVHPVAGFNMRPTDMQCAVLCAQIERFDSIMEKRRRIFSLYGKYLDGIPGIGFQPVPKHCTPCPWLFCITVDKPYGRSRDELMTCLEKEGIETRTFFQGAHTMVPYRQQHLIRGEYLPNTEHLSGVGMNLPTFNALTDEQIRYVSSLVRGFQHSPRYTITISTDDSASWTAEDSKRLGITVQNKRT